jgi:fluoride ion exporter CrcB/FEX
MRLLLVRVVLVLATVVLVVELLGVTPGVTLGLLAVNVVGALGLGETVDLTTGEASEELFSEAVGNSLA